MSHPLHNNIANALKIFLPEPYEIYCDPACGGDFHLPLFMGDDKSRASRTCCVDLLILEKKYKNYEIVAVIEIEESGFLPTKICGKVFQVLISDHFIHKKFENKLIKFSANAKFFQILDGSKILKKGSKKAEQGVLIKNKIKKLLRNGKLKHYDLIYIKNAEDNQEHAKVARSIISEVNWDRQYL